MRTGRMLTGTLVGVLAVIAASASGTHARGPVGDLDLSYIRTTQSEANANMQYGPVIADCNTFEAGFPLAGGNSGDGGAGEVYLNTAYPQPDQGASDPDSLPDGWRLFTDNVGAGPAYSIGASVICSAAGPPAYPIPVSNPNPQNVRNSAIAPCPAGTRVVGGGPLASGFFGEQRVAASVPIDDADQNRTPDDGWRVDLDNIGADNDETVTAHAVCHPDEGFSYVTKRFEARRGARAKGKARCPRNTLNVGGGVRGLGPYNSTWIVDHSTTTRFDDGEPIKAGWKARMEINAGPRRDFKVVAICHR